MKEVLKYTQLISQMENHAVGFGTFLVSFKGLLDFIGPLPSVALDKRLLLNYMRKTYTNLNLQNCQGE